MGEAKQIEHVHLVATKPVWAILSSLLGIIGAGFAFWMTTVQAQSDEIRDDVKVMNEHRHEAEQRLMRVETKLENMDKSQQRVESGVEGLTNKIDRLIEQQHDRR